MNAIERFRADLTARFPGLTAGLDPAGLPAGPWFLTIRRGDDRIVVEWRPRRGFEVALTDDGGYGVSTGFAGEGYQAALEHVARLLEPMEDRR